MNKLSNDIMNKAGKSALLRLSYRKLGRRTTIKVFYFWKQVAKQLITAWATKNITTANIGCYDSIIQHEDLSLGGPTFSMNSKQIARFQQTTLIGLMQYNNNQNSKQTFYSKSFWSGRKKRRKQPNTNEPNKISLHCQPTTKIEVKLRNLSSICLS